MNAHNRSNHVCVLKLIRGMASITLITDARDASPYVTLKPASLAACSTIARKSMATSPELEDDCSYQICSAVMRRRATWMRAGCMSNPMYRAGLLCADTASGDSSMLATVCPSSPNLSKQQCCTFTGVLRHSVERYASVTHTASARRSTAAAPAYDDGPLVAAGLSRPQRRRCCIGCHVACKDVVTRDVPIGMSCEG